ncbi:hypothetical protein PCANC_01644 [Puccinia coronata f. sp. avenae]|uniref:Alpha-type protein kinase domain-containing protein n=1 Tax=Puccinia coronata f. sp. avenae TaxID=200324 RepID=A0A2N5W3A3_9BASI|nr:hypothetical protein PCANC_01644 [Puccinia coronata f. sp. avenae]
MTTPQALQVKREEAISRAKQLYGPGTSSFPAATAINGSNNLLAASVVSAEHHKLNTLIGSVESYKTFIQFLKDNKVIDLIYNRDAFISNEEDCLAAEAHFQRSSTSGAAESCLSSQVFSPTIPTATHENLFESTKEIPLQSNKTSVAAVSKNMPTSPSLTPDLTPASLLVIPSKVNKNLSSYTLAGLDQEGVSNAILDPSDLLWERFGTNQPSSWLRDHDQVGWVDGARYQLDPDEILDSGHIYKMVAEYTLVKKDLSCENYMHEAYHTLRRYAVARQFLALFSHAIEVSAASSDVKEMAQLLRIVDAFPVHHDISYKRRSDDPFHWGQNWDLIHHPKHANSPPPDQYDLPQIPEDVPSRVFMMQEYIKDFKPLFHPLDYNHINDESSPATKLLHSFQHWVYFRTSGQMTITNLKGNLPILSNPKIADLNKNATWSAGVDAQSMLWDFIKHHTCTQVCSALQLPCLQEIPWGTDATVIPNKSEHQEKIITISNNTVLPNNKKHKKAKMDSEGIALLEVVRKGQIALTNPK